MRYKEDRIIYGRNMDYKIVRVSPPDGYDYEVKLSYDIARHPRGAIIFDGAITQVVEKVLYEEEMAVNQNDKKDNN